MEAQSISKQRSPKSPLPAEAPSGNVMTAWPEYMVDAFQRSVLFLDCPATWQRRDRDHVPAYGDGASLDHEVLMGLSLRGR